MKNSKRLLALALVIVSVLAISIPAMAGELTDAAGGKSAKYLFDISGRTTAPTFSIRTINTPVGSTADVSLNYNNALGSTYFMHSNTIGVYGGMTEKTLRQDPANYAFNKKISDRAQIELQSTNGTVSIRFSMN